MNPCAAKLLPVVALSCLAATGANAASVDWTLGPSFNGSTGYLGILTNGTLVEAVNLTGTNGSSLTVDPSGINLTFTTINAPSFGAAWASAGDGGSSDSAWGSILNTFEWSGSDVTTSNLIDGLVVGATYQVQFFAARTDCCGTRTLTFSNGTDPASATVGYDDYVSVVGTFVADATFQTFRFDDSVNAPALNAYVLRDVSPVPEPQTWTMLMAGLGLLGWAATRSRPAA